MKNFTEFLSNRKTASDFNARLKNFIEQYKLYAKDKPQKLKLLDVGCGTRCELFTHKRPQDTYTGCDFYDNVDAPIDGYKKINLNDQKLTDVFPGETFDVIFCGEVIEHLFSPDTLLSEIKSLMHKDTILILSTPNLAYYLNRIMLLFGISPFFLENSSEQKLGRFFKFLGQGNVTEGHIRMFTFRALKDLLALQKFEIVTIKPVYFWDNIVDRLVSRFSKSLSANNVFVLKKQENEK